YPRHSRRGGSHGDTTGLVARNGVRTDPDAPLSPRANWLEQDQQFVLAPARMRVTHARTPDTPGSPGTSGVVTYGLRRAAYPPAIAPTTRNGSAPVATLPGSGASGNSCDHSSY